MAKNTSPYDNLDENATHVSEGGTTEGFAYSQQHFMRNPNAHSEHLREVAAYLFSRGIGYTKVSWITSVNINTVRDWERAFKEGKFQPSFTHRQYDAEIKEKAIVLRKRGLSLKDISIKLGCSTTVVRNWLLEAQAAGKIEKTVSSSTSGVKTKEN